MLHRCSWDMHCEGIIWVAVSPAHCLLALRLTCLRVAAAAGPRGSRGERGLLQGTPIPRNHGSANPLVQVLRWFQDYPGHAHIYSIQHMVQCGMKYDKLPGEWWGPSTASYVLRDLARVHRMAYHGPVAVHVTQTDAVYISDIEALCANLSLNDCLLGLTESAAAQRAQNMKHVNSSIALHNRSSDPQDPLPCEASEEVDAFFDPLFHPPPSATSPWTCGLILLIPLRLGVNTVNAEYFDCLKEALRQECCVGILGGRVGHAIYFTGYDSSTDMLYGLDPHTVFAASESIHDVQKQIHVDGFVQLSIASLDPSLALGFSFADREAFDRFCKHYHSSKLISIQHTAPSYMMEDDCMDEGVPAWMAGFFDGNTGIAKGGGKTNYDSDEDDDYVIITK